MHEYLNNDIVGHKTQRALLKNLLQIDRFPHALLMCGKAGIGKRLLALEVAESILTRSLERNDTQNLEKTIKLIRQGEHPDLYFLLPKENKKSIGIEEIRTLQERLSLTPYYRTGACIIIEDAEKMSIQAANCLLKTLEEPIENRYFILLSSSPHLIPPTIVSRSQKLLLGTLQNYEIQEILYRLVGDSSSLGDFNDLLSILDGSLELLSLGAENRFLSMSQPKKEEIEKALIKARKIHDLSIRFAKIYETLDNSKRFLSESTHLLSGLEKEGDYTNSQIILSLIAHYRSALKKCRNKAEKLRLADQLIAVAKTWEETKSRNLNLVLQLGNSLAHS